MKTIKHIKELGVILIALLIIVTSCNQSQTGDKATEGVELDKEELKADIKEVVYPLPSPFEIYQKLDEMGASYLSDVMLPTENVDKYFTEKQKAIALGIYSADLSYVTIYNQTADIQQYTEVVKTLSDGLNIKINQSKMIAESVKEKIADKDTLTAFLTEVFYDTYSYLNKQGNATLSGLLVSGIWAEGLYIATHISDDTFNNYGIVKIIFDQKGSLEKVIELLKKFEETDLTQDILKSFEELKVIYDSVGTSLTEKQLNEITSRIEAIRAEIIK